jgi:hypothetical protein
MKNFQIRPFSKNCRLTEEKELKEERGEGSPASGMHMILRTQCASVKWKLCTEQEVIIKVAQILYR